jgi:hypothetical protein
MSHDAPKEPTQQNGTRESSPCRPVRLGTQRLYKRVTRQFRLTASAKQYMRGHETGFVSRMRCGS